jgi:hypothetical protein
MRTFDTLQSRISPSSALLCVMLSGAFIGGTLLSGVSVAAQSPSQPAASPTTSTSQHTHVRKSNTHPTAKTQEPPPVAQTPPPMPDWPANDKPSPASVVWDANGLRINASNSSLQQILSEVSTETGSKVEGMGADQRVYGVYGPGKARDVLSQLLQGSGYNVLLAGDIGQGAPRQIVLSPRQNGPTGGPAGMNRPQQEQEEDVPEQPEDQPQPPIQAPQTQNPVRPGFGPNGPIRTPQQVMEEMQQRQLQQQQMQQQQPQQQTAPQTNPQ